MCHWQPVEGRLLRDLHLINVIIFAWEHPFSKELELFMVYSVLTSGILAHN